MVSSVPGGWKGSGTVRLFYMLVLAVLVSAVAVIAYDLFQAEIEHGRGVARIRFDPATGQFTFRRPDVSVRIVYAGMFGPGEPVMRVRSKWIARFEEEYSDRLARLSGMEIPEADKAPFVADTLRRVRGLIADARGQLGRIDAEDDQARRTQRIEALATYLAENQLFLVPLGPKATAEQKLDGLRAMLKGLEALSSHPSPAESVRVAPLLVKVECRWQGRWVLSANRPRFLTGKEVPDIITGSKMELLALVQDGYAVPLDEALDGPDTYGNPNRRWRDAFIPKMLEKGKYTFLDDPELKDKTFLATLTCSTYCIFYNDVLFRRAGITAVPRTWPEFMDVCAKLQAAGITPLTADAVSYCDAWMVWLIHRAMGPETWERTILGAPADRPPSQRRPDPPWTDPRYVEVFSQIRALHDRGYFDKDFRGSSWPSAQREFAKGSAAMMICGSWLVQELAGYSETAGQENFKLECFSFPRWPGGRAVDQGAAQVSPYGLIVCRQGKATTHAIELVKYLSARDYRDMVQRNSQISCMADAGFSAALSGIEADFRGATAVYSRAPNVYARRFQSEALLPAYRKFFLQKKGDSDHESPEPFLKALQEKTVDYLRKGGEEGYE